MNLRKKRLKEIRREYEGRENVKKGDRGCFDSIKEFTEEKLVKVIPRVVCPNEG